MLLLLCFSGEFDEDRRVFYEVYEESKMSLMPCLLCNRGINKYYIIIGTLRHMKFMKYGNVPQFHSVHSLHASCSFCTLFLSTSEIILVITE